jgi:hypothetical protein
VGAAHDKTIWISTIFLGVSHGDPDRPYLFETMVFAGTQSLETQRYRTWAWAEAGHRSVVAKYQALAQALTGGRPEDDRDDDRLRRLHHPP